MKYYNNINLKDYNTFHINSIAKNFYIIEYQNDLLELSSVLSSQNYFVLGDGSNILLSREVYDNVIKIDNKGIDIIHESENFVDVKVAAGENWHEFLEFLLINNLYGLENLALIPGKCGAAPIQNIGAYGVEQEQYFLKAILFDTVENRFIEINKGECNFNYRYSIFKKSEYKRYIITDVVYRLNREFNPNLNYNELKKLSMESISPRQLFDYICNIRKSKIPYPDEVANAGSFFKNPFISAQQLSDIQQIYPDIPNYKFNEGYKLSAAWLIEKSGMKGKVLNANSDAQVSARHSLILINNGKASGAELIELSEEIINKVKIQFGVELEREVNII